MSFVRSIRPFSHMFRSDAASQEAAATGADIAPVVTAPGADAPGGAASAEAIAQLQEGSTLHALSIAASSADDSQLAALLDGADSRDIAALVTEGSSSRVRQSAAQRVTDAAELRNLLKLVRGKDKSVYKIIKQKCDELRTEEQKSVQVETDAAAACASLERHGQRVYDAVAAGEERAIDEIIRASGLPSSTVSVALLGLEMKRLLRQLPGKLFIRNQ